jgi:hypothetical protein
VVKEKGKEANYDDAPVAWIKSKIEEVAASREHSKMGFLRT